LFCRRNWFEWRNPSVAQIEQRITEAEKLGYEKIFVSNLNKIPKRKFGIKIEEVSKIEDFHERLF
jgi:DNA repair protein RadA/Sms